MRGTPSNPGLERARWLSDLLDRRLIDPALGFVLPGLGDAISSTLGLYLIVVAWQRNHSKLMLARMLVNLGLDSAIGSIPVVGDVFDVFFRANRRNLALLERPPDPRRNRVADAAIITGALVFFLAALSAPIIVLVSAIAWIV